MSQIRTNSIAPVGGIPAGASGGGIIQIVNTNYTTFFSTTSTVPLDDTIPQNTEGAEVTTLSITPRSANNKILVRVIMQVTNDNSSYINAISLYRDSVANALASSWSRTVANNNPVSAMVIEYLDSPSTTSAITYKVRAGTNGGTGGQTLQINGGSGVRYLGGALSSGITLMEVSG